MSLFPSSVDRQFARFCRSGDPAALGVVFDRTAAELLRVACFLVGHRADAEDLVQRTFLAAIEARGSFRPGARALPWLLGILANHGKQLQRERRRQPPRIDEPSADPVAHAAERELSERLTALRADLGAPYADVVRLHLEQGLNAKEIAAQLQRPAGTVRTQLMRALELLRQRLPDGFVAGGAFVFLGRPSTAAASTLLAMRQAVVRAAGGTPATAAGIVPTAVIGSLFVSKYLVAVASVLVGLSLLGGWLAWPDAAPAPAAAPAPPAAAAATGSLPAVAANAPGSAAAAARTDAGEGAMAAATADPDFATLRVLVRWGTDEPAAGIGVFATNGRPSARRDGVTDGNGVVELPRLAPGTWSVTTALGHGDLGNQETPAPRCELAAGALHTLEVRVLKLAVANGRVVDADGAPVPDARIWMSADGDGSSGHEVARSDGRGAFAVPIHGAHHLGARKAGFAPSRTIIANPLNVDEPFVLRLEHAGGAVRGVVRDERGAPVPWARVLVGEEIPHLLNSTTQPTGEMLPRGVEVTSGRDGAFAIDGVTAGLHDVRAWAAGRAPFHGGVEVPTKGAVSLTVVLGPGATVRGTVRDAAGAPCAGAIVRWNHDHEFAHAETRTAADGSYELGDLADGDQQLAAELGGARATARVTLTPGMAATWDPVLTADLGIAGRVLDARGGGLAGIDVEAQRGAERIASATTDANGAFLLQQLGTEPVTLEITQRLQVLRRQDDVAPGRRDVMLTLTEHDLPSAFLVGRIVDERGGPVAAGLVPWHTASPQANVHRNDEATGAFRIGPLRPGRYELAVESAAFGRTRSPAFDLAPGETRDLGAFVLKTPGGASFTVSHFGRPAAGGLVFFRQPDGAWSDTTTIDHGRAKHTALPVGVLYVTAEFQGLTASTEVVIEAGRVATAHLDLQRTHRATVTLTGSDGIDRATLPLLVARRTDGSFAGLFAAANLPGPPSYFVDLPPERYSLRVLGDEANEALAIDLRAGHATATMTLPAR